MAKLIWDNFLGGLSVHSDNIGTPGMYAEARDMDPHRDPGFIMPGYVEAELATSAATLAGLIRGAVTDPDSINVFAIDSGKLYKFTNFGVTIASDVNWPHTVTNGEDLVFYHIGAARKLLYIQDLDIGMSTPATPDFDDDWGSTVPADGAALTAGMHPKIIWDDGILYIGNGRYLASLDGQTGANGTLNTQALDLELGWEITSLFPTRNYIGICAWRKMTGGTSYGSESRVFFWDGHSPSFNYWIPVEDNIITASNNLNGVIYLMTEGRGLGAVIRELGELGAEQIKNLRFDKSGTVKDYYNSATVATYPNVLATSQNRLIIGAVASAYQNAIFAYGSVDPKYPPILTQPYSSANTPAVGNIGFVGQLFRGYIYASFYDGTTYYWSRFVGGNSTNAIVKGLYKELPEKAKVNYVKFYFKTLVSGDSVTVSLDSDYGTSNSLGTITYATEGAVTSKRFDKPSIKGHSIRPVLDYTAGGVAFSRVVVDYSDAGDVG